MYKVCSLFAGIGGICKGFQNAGFDVVYANEYDKFACQTYKANHTIPLEEADINDVVIKDIPQFDVLTGGFPCQPFSLAGNRQGMQDTRGTLFFNIVQVLKHHMPQAFLLENVANLQTVRKGGDFATILQTLQQLGYTVHYQILGSHTHGNIPQCRRRIFIVGFLSSTNFQFPGTIPLTKTIDDIIDRTKEVDGKYYYNDTSQYYPMLERDILNQSIYQLRRVYVRENKNNLCPTLTANMGCGGHNVPLIKDDFGIRKLTPNECAKLQGFISLKQVCSDAQTYKQIGNSVCLPLIKRIADNIHKALE